MSSSNRELVIDFVSYKLSQKGYSWSQLEEEDENRTDIAAEGAGLDGVLNGSPSWHPPASHAPNGATVHRSSLEVHDLVQAADVRQALREAGDEFELRYRRAFSDLTSQLHITLGTAYQSFEQVVNELFRDGVNWGRIVAFFSFGGALCVESVDKEMRVLVGRIVSWMTTYLTDHLDPWIQENGGWVRAPLPAASGLLTSLEWAWVGSSLVQVQPRQGYPPLEQAAPWWGWLLCVLPRCGQVELELPVLFVLEPSGR